MANKKIWELPDNTNPNGDNTLPIDNNLITQKISLSAITEYVQNNIIPPYKVYTALLTQTGTNAPVVTVLENTLSGDIVWTRSDVGLYIGTLTGEFINNKTVITPPSNANNVGGGFLPDYIQVFGVYRLNSNEIQLTTGKQEMTTGIITATDGYLYPPNSIEIRVYN